MNNISAKDLLDILLKNLIIIILAAVVFAVGAFVYCEEFTAERFASKGSILVTNGGLITDEDGKPVENSQIAASVNLIPTIRKLLDSPKIYEEVAQKFNGKYSAGQLRGAMRLAVQEEDSMVLDISFELASSKNDTSAKEDVVAITNAFLDEASEYVSALIVNTRIYITTPASSSYKTAPQTVRTTAIGFMAGAVLCYAIVFLIFIFNITIKSDEDFSTHYDVPVLGNIPDFNVKSNKKSYYKSKE